MSPSKKGKVYKTTEDQESIQRVIKEKLLFKPLYVQLPTMDKKIAEIFKVTDHGVAVHFKNLIPPIGTLVLTGMIKNYYAEIGLRVLEPIQKSFYICSTLFLRISLQSRREQRIHVDDETEIFAKRIRIGLSELEIRGNTIPVEYKKVMEKYMKDKSKIADYVMISTFERKSLIHQEVAKTGKTFFISDTRIRENFEQDLSLNDDLIDLNGLYGSSIESERHKMMSKDIIGRIVLPIFGPKSNDKWVAIGFIDIISKTPLDFMKLMEIKALSFEIVESICETNQMEVKEAQRILDISRTGMRMLIKGKELVNAMLHRPLFTFNIHIKGQAPIPVVGIIKMKKKIDDYSIQVGVKIKGEIGRQEHMSRYYEYFDSLTDKS